MNELLEIIANLKTVPRKGWRDKLNILNPESVADHSFSVATIAMILSDMLQLDTSKVVKMSLLHDLAESITGDFTPNDIDRKEKEVLERKTMKKILEKLPASLVSSYENIWDELLSNKTPEANLVHEIDKLEMLLQSRIYQKEGYPKERFESFIKTAKKEIKNPVLKEISDKLLQ